MQEVAHQMAERYYGRDEPLPGWELVDEGKLLSAIATPRPVFGFDQYPTLPEKAAVLLYSIAKAHALANGNKRIALTSTFAFLALNERWWHAEPEEVRSHVTWVASSESRLRSHVLAYLAPYFERRIITLEEAIGGRASTGTEASSDD